METSVLDQGQSWVRGIVDSYGIPGDDPSNFINSVNIFNAMKLSSKVKSHLDFYRWLRSDIHPILPHESLLAVWGDFARHELNYDVTSSGRCVDANTISGVKGIETVMERLFETVSKTGESWIAINDFQRLAEECGIDTRSRTYRVAMARTRQILVYVLKDKRSMNDCLYVFSISDLEMDLNPSLLDLLMPHIDTALRKIKSLSISARSQSVISNPKLDALSAREREVLNWVSEGKSNEEIGIILGISQNTVKNHLKRIFNKMGVTARSQAVRVFIQGVSDAL